MQRRQIFKPFSATTEQDSRGSRGRGRALGSSSFLKPAAGGRRRRDIISHQPPPFISALDCRRFIAFISKMSSRLGVCFPVDKPSLPRVVEI